MHHWLLSVSFIISHHVSASFVCSTWVNLCQLSLKRKTTTQLRGLSCSSVVFLVNQLPQHLSWTSFVNKDFRRREEPFTVNAIRRPVMDKLQLSICTDLLLSEHADRNRDEIKTLDLYLAVCQMIHGGKLQGLEEVETGHEPHVRQQETLSLLMRQIQSNRKKKKKKAPNTASFTVGAPAAVNSIWFLAGVNFSSMRGNLQARQHQTRWKQIFTYFVKFLIIDHNYLLFWSVMIPERFLGEVI